MSSECTNTMGRAFFLRNWFGSWLRERGLVIAIKRHGKLREVRLGKVVSAYTRHERETYHTAPFDT